MEKIPFTKRAVAALEVPQSGRYYVGDSKTPHFFVCVTSKGSKTYYRCGRINRQFVRTVIGSAFEITPEQARERCKELNAMVAAGIDPRKPQDAPERTFGELWEWYFDNHSKKHKKSWQRDERRYNRLLKPWANRPLSTITTDVIAKLHTQVTRDDGPYAGNHVLELVRHMFAMAIDLEWVDRNPCRKVKKNRVRSRERFLQEDELQRFFEGLAKLKRETTRDFFLMALFTGARRGNTAAMRWDQIDFENHLWHIPAGESKNAEPMVIPLTEHAMAILQRRRNNGSPWVFPGHGKRGHLVEPKHAWRVVCEHAGLENLRLHDLRRTLGSWQAKQNTSLHIIGKSLGHKSPKSTEVYARLQVDPIRASVSAAIDAMMKSAKKK